MVHKFLVFTVSVAAIFVQVHGLGVYNEGPTPRNDAEKLLQKLDKTVDNALVKAQEELDAAAKKVNATADTVQSAAVSQMQGIEQKLQQEIDELKQKAAKARVNIDDCLKRNEDDLAYADDTFPEPEDVLAREARNKVTDLLNELKEKVENAMNNALNALETAKNKIKEAAVRIEKAAKQKLKAIEGSLLTELNKIKEKAKDAAVDIGDCLKGNEDRLVNLPNQLANDMVYYVTDIINQEISYGDDAVNRVEKVVNAAEDLNNEIKNCGHGFHAVTCLAKLAVKIGKDVVTLPAEIANDVAATELLITGLEENLEQCALQKVNQCENDGMKILTDIAACAAKKIIT